MTTLSCCSRSIRWTGDHPIAKTHDQGTMPFPRGSDSWSAMVIGLARGRRCRVPSPRIVAPWRGFLARGAHVANGRKRRMCTTSESGVVPHLLSCIRRNDQAAHP
nr:hypothetical protein CFP56_63534 [Quercus suber]